MTTATLENTYHKHNNSHEHAAGERVTFGFWIYLMTDLILFGGLFIAYMVLRNNTVGGPSTYDIFQLPFVLVETFLLLASSFTFGLAMLALNKKSLSKTKLWLIVTLVLGFCFVVMEVYEFCTLIGEGYGPSRSAFLSAFFTLIATHGLHVSVGLIWIIVMLIQLSLWSINSRTIVRMTCLSMFWHFLDIVWICVFTVVYLIGKLPIA